MEATQSAISSPEVNAIPQWSQLRAQAVPRQRVWLHVLLYLLTICTTVWVGSMLFGGYAAGALFSAGLLSILTAHESGHYVAAKKYGVPVSLPYFIPLPLPPFGTFGAVIRMSPRIPNRRALFDIAAAGPLAGLILAIPLSYWGILHSRMLPESARAADGGFAISVPMLFRSLTWLANRDFAHHSMDLSPLAYAGWAGMFVTALNLLPIGQLDGGHVTHALFGSRSWLVAAAMFFGLGEYCIVMHTVTWLPLLALLLLMGVRHPRSMDDGLPLGRIRQVLGAILAVIFITCFSLSPISL